MHHSFSPVTLAKGHRLLYVCALVVAAVGTLVSYLPPFFLKSVIDSGLGSVPWGLPAVLASVPACLAAMFLAAALGASLSFLSGFGTQKAAEGMARGLRQTLFGHIQHLGFEPLSRAPTGDWVQRCTSDVDTLRRLVALQLPELVNNVLQACWALPILFVLHPGLAWFAVPVLPAVVGFSLFFFTRVQRAFLASDESEGRLSGILQENITGVRVVKAFARQDHEIERFARENAHYRRVTRRVVDLFAQFWGTVNFLCMVQMGLVLTAGVEFVRTGQASVGTVVMFLTMTGMLVWPIRQLGRVLTDLGKAQVSWGRIREILDLETEDLGTPEDPARPWAGRIEFREVTVRRGGSILLDALTFTIPAGAKAAILGPTGSGKSTLVHLLGGLIDYEGEILLDGRELGTIPKSELRRNVGLVLQEPWLFAKTIGENLRLAHDDASVDEVIAAARTAWFHEAISGFPRGYDTLLGERGVTLSGGQRQRTAIAQMLVRHRAVLVFDDSLSAVDNHTDALIRRSLRPMSTVILISHRLSTLAEADLILVLEKGRLVQSGTERELVAVEGLYRRMAELQNALQHEGAPTGGEYDELGR